MSAPSVSHPVPIRVSAVVGFLVFVELTSGFLQGYYLPLFGEIARQFDVSVADITWFMTVQTLAAGVSVPILAKLGDIFGHRRMLRIAVVAVLVGTVVVAWAPSYPVVLVGRLLMGPLAVWLPLEIALVHNRLTGPAARNAIGMLVGSLAFGVVLGSLAAGAIASVVSSVVVVLLVPAVLVACCVVMIFVAVPESTIRTARAIDYVGFAGLAAFMIFLLWGLRAAQVSGFGAAATVGPLVAAGVVLVAFVVWELRVPTPAVNIRLVASRRLWPLYLLSFVFGMVFLGSATITPTFLAADPDAVGYGFGLAPGTIALTVATGTAALAAGAALFAVVARVVGIRGVIMVGALVGAAGNLVLVFGSHALPAVVVGVVVTGVGSGFLLGSLPALIAELSPPDQTGIATGLYNSLKTLGGSAAGAVFGLVLAASVFGGTTTSLTGFVTVWSICAGALVVGPIVMILVGTRRAQPVSPSAVAAVAQ